MNRCTTSEMKANMEAAEFYQKQGIDFWPVPVSKSVDKKALIALSQKQLDELGKEVSEDE